MRTGSRISLLLGLTGLVLTGLFLFGVFLSGEELAAVDIWKQSESMPAREALAWRKNPEAYAAHSVEITPEMNPVAISIAHWSQSAGFPRSSKFTLTVEDSTGRLVLNKELGLSQKRNEGGSGTPIFEWTSDTPVISLLNDYLEVIEAGTYTFRLIPGETQAGNHTRLQLRLRKQASRPQWWMVIAGFPLVFIAVCTFMLSTLARMNRGLKNRRGLKKKE
ncbi:MAG: hypothetical protein NZ935_07670 [Planctomycetes bacterium]|nr:hypothetical protein [Planctomycetota bacterium]